MWLHVYLLESSTLSLQKVIFLKNHRVYLQAIFYDVTSGPREHFKVVRFGAEMRNVIFWPSLAQGSTLIYFSSENAEKNRESPCWFSSDY